MDNWKGIYGQQSALKVLDELVNSGKIPHALLFQGLNGCGKDFVAIRFAQALNNKYAATESEAQRAIKQIGSLSEPFIKYIFPLPRGKNETESSGPIEKLGKDDLELFYDELSRKIDNPYHKIILPKANFIKISSIRDIKKFLSLSYNDINYRIVLISEAHLMNEEAQNALLKSLEEPPEGVIFILTTHLPNKLRETIRSRCWTINFQPLNESSIKSILIKYFDVDDDLAEEISPFAGGSVAMALKLMENDFQQLRDATIHILRYSFGKKYHSALDAFAPFLTENGTESVKLLIQMIIIWLNDIQRFRLKSENYFFSGYKDTLEKFNSKFPNVNLNEIVYKLDYLSSTIQKNVNLNLIVLNVVFELSALTGRIIN